MNMKVIIATEKHNPFLKRKEIIVNIEHESEPTPQKAALQQYLARELNTEAEKIEVKNIFTDVGLPKSQAKIFAWEEKIIKQETGETKPEKEAAKETKEEASAKEEQKAEEAWGCKCREKENRRKRKKRSQRRRRRARKSAPSQRKSTQR